MMLEVGNVKLKHQYAVVGNINTLQTMTLYFGTTSYTCPYLDVPIQNHRQQDGLHVRDVCYCLQSFVADASTFTVTKSCAFDTRSGTFVMS